MEHIPSRLLPDNFTNANPIVTANPSKLFNKISINYLVIIKFVPLNCINITYRFLTVFLFYLIKNDN